MARDFLARILDKKKEEVEAAGKAVPIDLLKEKALDASGRRPFFGRLSTPARFGGNIIAEIKRGSPSRGIIREGLDRRRRRRPTKGAVRQRSRS